MKSKEPFDALGIQPCYVPRNVTIYPALGQAPGNDFFIVNTRIPPEYPHTRRVHTRKVHLSACTVTIAVLDTIYTSVSYDKKKKQSGDVRDPRGPQVPVMALLGFPQVTKYSQKASLLVPFASVIISA